MKAVIRLMAVFFGMEIGTTIASDKHPNAIDSFWFAIRPVRPFDFVTVEHIHDTKCIGMVQYFQTFRDENKGDSFTEVTVAKVVLMARSTMSERSLNPVNLPVGLGKSVRFFADEIKFALGIPKMDNP